MLETVIHYVWPYGVVITVLIILGLGAWTGIRESKEAYRRVYGQLSELFETKPQSYVVRSLSKPDSSKVGLVEIGEDSVMTSVYSGSNEFFIDNETRDRFFSIPWERIDAIEQLSEKRVSVLVNHSSGRPTKIIIPWSKDMTLEGWVRYKEISE